LKKYIDTLKPFCGPENLDYCSEEQKKTISVIGKMTQIQLESKLKVLNKEIEDMEKDHQELLKSLQSTFKESSEKLDILKKEKNSEISIIEEYLSKDEEEEKDENYNRKYSK
jgi:Skp family chaperone for outer membrane proteins